MLNHHCCEGAQDLNGKGAFIVIEGLDGSGKTTQAKLLVRALRRTRDAGFTAEPSHGEIGRFIRRRILYGEKRMPTAMEALLFAADRIDHVQNEVMPALSSGRVIVSDRYLYSSLAYQGSAGLDLEWIQAVNGCAVRPDLALFVDVSPEIVLKRLKRKKSVMENLATQQRVREVYLLYVEKGDLIRVDGEKARGEVAKSVLDIVSEFLKRRY